MQWEIDNYLIIIMIIDINLCRPGVVSFGKNRTRFIKQDYIRGSPFENSVREGTGCMVTSE
jgi:hypothetical protein